MGYCTYGGKPVPINDQAGCIGGGGNWVEDQSALISDPTMGQGVPMTGTTEAPMQNLTAYMIPGAGPAKQAATKALPYVKKGVQSLFTKPGVVQKTIPKMKQMADGTVKQIGTKTVDKAGRVMSVPRASATAIGASGLYNNAVSPNPYGGAGPVTDRQVVNRQDAPNIFNQGAAGQPPTTPTPPPPPASSYWSDTWDRARAPAGGGSGAWDTNLYRLGEQMSHMGTPLSKRGKGPSDRWTTASNKAADLKATSAKAANSAAGEDFWKNIAASKMNETTLLKLFTPESGGMFGDNKQEATTKGAARVAAYISKRAELIRGGKLPTHQDVMNALKSEKKDK